jgi:hypothetical protein
MADFARILVGLKQSQRAVDMGPRLIAVAIDRFSGAAENPY